MSPDGGPAFWQEFKKGIIDTLTKEHHEIKRLKRERQEELQTIYENEKHVDCLHKCEGCNEFFVQPDVSECFCECNERLLCGKTDKCEIWPCPACTKMKCVECTSGKNSVPVKPCRTAKEVVAHLAENPDIGMRDWARTDKDTYICFQEWNDAIDTRNEFRLFVFGDRIVALSPQRYWACHDYTQEELEAVEKAVLTCKLENPFAPGIPYIIDAWIDFELRVLHVIEYNCFGDHSGAGSSLFNWIKDHNLLYGQEEQTQFRFVSAVDLSN